MRTVRGILAAILAWSLGTAAAESAATAARRQREPELIQVLTAATPLAEKDKACRELQLCGTAACIPALAGLLADAQLSHLARCVLEPMSDPAAGQALREALARTEGQLKAGIIHSLGFRRDAQAVRDLLPLLRSDDAVIVGAAAVAVGQAGSVDAAPALAEFRATAPAALRPVAAEASLALAERLVAQGQGDAAARI